MRDLPTMSTSSTSSIAYSTADLGVGAQGPNGPNGLFGARGPVGPAEIIKVAQIKGQLPMVTRRIVRVFISDPDENLPLDNALLWSGEEKVTDATDQELFFELDIKHLLDQHNATRIKIVDRKIRDRKEFLEPAKVRDLKMVVVTVANL